MLLSWLPVSYLVQYLKSLSESARHAHISLRNRSCSSLILRYALFTRGRLRTSPCSREAIPGASRRRQVT